jgi:predicted amidohydrolase
MGHKLRVAAVQMDVTQAPVLERLGRASDLIFEAVGAGAQLVVLPELFNSGYEFQERNYALAETIDGQTVTWMREQATRHSIHLVGSLPLVDETDIYIAALLLTPDGRTWRHDKIHLELWERAYFKAGDRITIADTDLGKLGLMICSDTLRPDLWAQHAGNVHAMVLMFSPGGLDTAYLVFPDGFRLKYSEFERAALPADEEYDPDDDDGLWAQIPWMNVLMVSASEAGVLHTKLPELEVLLRAAKLEDRASQASEVWLEMEIPKATGIWDPKEGFLAQGSAIGDGVVLAEIELADTPPKPKGPQPKLYVGEDHIAKLVRPLYREGVRRQWGAHMAPDSYRE